MCSFNSSQDIKIPSLKDPIKLDGKSFSSTPFFVLRILISFHLFNFILVFLRGCSTSRKDKWYFDNVFIEISLFQTSRSISKVAFSLLSFAIAIDRHTTLENAPLMKIDNFQFFSVFKRCCDKRCFYNLEAMVFCCHKCLECLYLYFLESCRAEYREDTKINKRLPSQI